MVESTVSKLQVVDGLRLPVEYRSILQPGGMLRDAFGHERLLPRFFYEVSSWQEAKEAQLTPNFALWEFIHTDVREAKLLRGFPRYVPCAVTLLTLALQRFRDSIGSSVHIAANGGYRSPHHVRALTCHASLHCWGTAVDIYRIGETYLDMPDRIQRYADLVHEAIPGAWTDPTGSGIEETDDHLHFDLGYVVVVPHHVRVDAPVPAEAFGHE